MIFRIYFSFRSTLEGKHIRLSGILSTEPKEYGTSLLISLHDLRFFVPQNSDILFGSKITVEGIVRGSDLTKVKIISVVPPNSVLPNIRRKILSNMRSVLPEPLSALLAGVTLGAPNIPTVLGESLRKTGTSHIVVASGGNLAILAAFMESVLSKVMKRKMFLPLISLILLVYCSLTGFGAPIVRALIMWLAIMGVQYTGRVVSSTRVLFVTVLIMLLYKPMWIFDVSFELSIGATTGILVFGSKLNKLLRKVPLIREALSMSIAAQVGILPVSIFVFREVNIWSPFWNVLVSWTVPYITVIGMVGSILTLISQPLGQLVFVFCFPICWYFVQVVSLI